jgi:O-antigen/teichoic acid export membrane protein
MFLVAATELGQQIMQLVCLFALVHDPSHVYRYAIIPIPIRVITAAFRMWYSVKCGFLNLADIKLTLKGGFTFFKEAAPLGLSQVAIALYYNCDSILLGIFKGETAVGIYATAYSLMLVSISISGALTGSYAPSLARSTSDPALFSKLSNELLETLCWFGLPLSTLGLATGRGAIQFLYGSGFAESGPVFELLCLNIACIFFSVGVGQPSIAAGWQKQVFYATTAGGVANLCLNLWLIPRFGIGAAIATTVIAEFIVGATICYMRRDLLRVEFLHSVFPSLATAVVVGAMAKAGFAIFHLPWWLCAGTGGTLAALCAFRFAHSAFIAKIGGRVSSLVGIKLVR